MLITIKEDGEGYIASVLGSEDYLFAFGYSEKEAEQGLYDVIDMTISIHQELIQKETACKQFLAQKLRSSYAL